jgi:hypothetical protein
MLLDSVEDVAMLASIINLIIIYIYLFFLGVGLWAFLTPDFLRKRYLFPILPIAYGLLLQSIICVYYIFTNNHVTQSIYLCLLIATFSLFSAIKYKKYLFLEEYNNIKQLNLKQASKILLVIGILLLILSPVLRAEYPTTPYRVGSDQLGYAETAKFLINGGTLDKATNNIKSELQAPTIDDALSRVETAINSNIIIDAVFLVEWPRWGVPGTIANITSLVKAESPYEAEFLLLIFPYLILFGICFYIMKELVKISENSSLFAAIALLLNCNLLNLYYEGHYAQFFTAPFFFLILISYLKLRQSNTLDKIKSPSNMQMILFISFITAGILSSYPESFALVVLFVAMCTFLDLIIERKIRFYSIILMMISSIIGIAISLPIVYQIISIMSKLPPYLFRQLHVAGFWQPHWALLDEILGLSNMYVTQYTTGAMPILLNRSIFDFLFNISLSLFILGLLINLVIKNKNIDKVFWLSAPILIFINFCKTCYYDHLHNYQYMKVYTMFLPLLFIIAYMAIDYWSINSGKFNKIFKHFIKYSFIILVIFNGFTYITQYIRESGYVTADMSDLQNCDKKYDLNSYVLSIPNIGMQEKMLIPFMHFNYLNQDTVKYIYSHMDQNILLLINKKYIDCPSCYISKNADNIMYENKTYIIVNTKKNIKELFYLRK